MGCALSAVGCGLWAIVSFFSSFSCIILCSFFLLIVSTRSVRSYDWKNNMDLNTLRRVWTEIGAVYPCSWKRFKFFNCGATLNIVMSMLRPYLPVHARQRMEFGCLFEVPLDRLFLVPNLQIANARLMQRFTNTLAKRYENETSFRL